MVQRADGALGFSGRAGFAAEKDETQREVAPLRPGDESHEVEFNFLRVLVFRQPEPAGYAPHVGAHHDARLVEGGAEHHVADGIAPRD